jgi:hypothetical protein
MIGQFSPLLIGADMSKCETLLDVILIVLSLIVVESNPLYFFRFCFKRKNTVDSSVHLQLDHN